MGRLVLGDVLTPMRGPSGSLELHSCVDAAIAIDDEGVISEIGPQKDLRPKYRDTEVDDYSGKIIIPAFLDIHTHPPQLDMMGRAGSQLLEWLDQHTFPAEKGFAARACARDRTERYIQEQIRNGITTALWFGTSSEEAVDEMFLAAEAGKIRAIIGKVSMDQNAPKALLQETSQDRDSLSRLYEKWHGKSERLFLAITPRFAPACSSSLMRSLAEFGEQHPDVFIQTHLSENLDELKFADQSHPGHSSYTHIYHEHGLLKANTVLAHCIHVDDRELDLINEAGAILAHCPTSNMFLGSGLCSYGDFDKKGIATDIGAGTTLCMWETMRAAYGVSQLRGKGLTPLELFAGTTLEPAEALGLPVGSLEPGKQADFQVLSSADLPLLATRLESADSKEERLLALLAHGRTGVTMEVYCSGEKIGNFTSDLG